MSSLDSIPAIYWCQFGTNVGCMAGRQEAQEATEDWAAVAQAVTGRLEQRRMTQLEAASRAKISLTTLRELQNNTSPRRRRPQTLAALSEALGWPPEYLSAILHGEEARPHRAEADDPVLQAIDSMERDLRDLRQRVTSLERRLAGEDAQREGPPNALEGS